jgi:hypothetical protein
MGRPPARAGNTPPPPGRPGPRSRAIWRERPHFSVSDSVILVSVPCPGRVRGGCAQPLAASDDLGGAVRTGYGDRGGGGLTKSLPFQRGRAGSGATLYSRSLDARSTSKNPFPHGTVNRCGSGSAPRSTAFCNQSNRGASAASLTEGRRLFPVISLQTNTRVTSPKCPVAVARHASRTLVPDLPRPLLGRPAGYGSWRTTAPGSRAGGTARWPCPPGLALAAAWRHLLPQARVPGGRPPGAGQRRSGGTARRGARSRSASATLASGDGAPKGG